MDDYKNVPALTEIADLKRQLAEAKPKADRWDAEGWQDIDAFKERNRWLRARVETLTAALREVNEESAYQSHDGHVKCRFCDEVLDNGRDKHFAGCLIHSIDAALSGKE